MMTLADQFVAAITATAWDMEARGNIAAAEAYRAAAGLATAIFKDAPNGN